MPHKSEIKNAVGLVNSEVENFTDKLIDDVKNYGPNTTPDFDLYFGSNQNFNDLISNLVESENDWSEFQRSYIEAILLGYLSLRDVNVKGYENLDIQKFEVLLEQADELERPKAGAVYGGNLIFFNFLPSEFFKDLEEISQSEQKNLVEKCVVGLEKYSKIVESGNADVKSSEIKLGDDKFDYQKMLEISIHEITHTYIQDNTRRGVLKQFWSEQELRSIDEGFSFFSNFVVFGLEKDMAEYFSRYPVPDQIEWVVRVLRNKVYIEELDSQDIVDWTRKEAERFFNTLADYPPTPGDEKSIDPLAIFLREMLPKEEREKFKQFREINGRKLNRILEDIEKLLNDIKTSGLKGDNKRIIDKLREDEKKIKDLKENLSVSKNRAPVYLEDKIMHKILLQSMPDPNLLKISRKANNLMQKEVEWLSQILKDLEYLKENLPSEFSEEIDYTEKEILELREDLPEF